MGEPLNHSQKKVKKKGRTNRKEPKITHGEVLQEFINSLVLHKLPVKNATEGESTLIIFAKIFFEGKFPNSQ